MIIKINNLTKIYNGKIKALNDINIEIPEGLFGLIGRNGAGKTTLMRIMATVIRQSSGAISFDDKNIFENLKEYRGLLGYLPQTTRLMPHYNIVGFLDYVCVLKGIENKHERKAEVERCIKIVGLIGEEKKKLSKYSGGMLRRAGIAQALIGNPKLLIIDEPTAGLDPEERLYFLNMISRISEDKTIIFSTHITHDIDNICENICILETGNVMYLGNKDTLVSKIKGKVWECRIKAEEEAEFKQKVKVVSITCIKRLSVVRYISDESVYDNSIQVEPTLEDAYIFTLGGVKR